MNRQINESIFTLLCLLTCFLIGHGDIDAQTASVQPQPIYNQCRSLTMGSNPDDAVARAIASLKENDPKARALAAQQLGQSCDKRAVEPMIALLRDQDLPVRLAAIEALGRLGDPESVHELNGLVDDQDWRIRLALISSLASFHSYHPRNLVVNTIANPNGEDLTDPDDVRVRCAAILTANQMTDVVHSRKSILFLHIFLQSKLDPIRRIAEEAMFALKNTRNGPSELIGLLKLSNNVEIRLWTAQWIGKLGIENGRDVLTEVAAKDPHPKVKQAAAEALKALNKVKGNS
jgi:HEAT repeat protein